MRHMFFWGVNSTINVICLGITFTFELFEVKSTLVSSFFCSEFELESSTENIHFYNKLGAHE